MTDVAATVASPMNASDFVHHLIREAFDAAQMTNYTLEVEQQPPAWQVWGVGLAIVTACSFSAPLGILIVPCFSKALYERIMTFLIALGIGALSGSTVFIMIPQAFNISSIEGANYHTKSTIILLALYLFFTVDRILQYILEMRRRRQAKRRIHASTINGIMHSPKLERAHSGRHHTETTDLASIREEREDDLTSQGVSPLPDKEDRERQELENFKEELEIAMVNNALTRSFSTRRRTAVVSSVDKIEFRDEQGLHKIHINSNENDFLHKVNHEQHNKLSLPVVCLPMHHQPRKSVSSPPTPEAPRRLHPPKQLHAMTEKPHTPPKITINDRKESDDTLSLDVTIVEKKVIEKGNIEVASVAYMIIFGSSANNFVDGMSTGAAFADGIMSGLSIGLAVLSQQFPQELGTLAILVNSGLGLKRTLMFNMIPIVLSYIGFVIGVFLDALDEDYDTYIFSISSGMYLYIFLGTLIPEIRESTNELIKENIGESVVVSLLQTVGIASGLAFMYFMSTMGDLQV